MDGRGPGATLQGAAGGGWQQTRLARRGLLQELWSSSNASQAGAPEEPGRGVQAEVEPGRPEVESRGRGVRQREQGSSPYRSGAEHHRGLKATTLAATETSSTVLVRNLGCDICLSCVKIEIKIGRECHLSLEVSNGGWNPTFQEILQHESRPGGIKGI